ncbi:MAG: hypothetical protein IPP17_21965 [Bacteroidetes bacterium]|nr:hypothetical protein [Bacteroidota bacterium]
MTWISPWIGLPSGIVRLLGSTWILVPALPVTMEGFLPETVNVCVLGVKGAIIAVRLTGVSEDADVSVELVGDWQEKVRTARRARSNVLRKFLSVVFFIIFRFWC